MHESLMVLTTDLVIIAPSTWTIFLGVMWIGGAVFALGREPGGVDRQTLSWWIVPAGGSVLLLIAYGMLIWSRMILDNTLRAFGCSTGSLEEMFLSVLKSKEIMVQHNKQFDELQAAMEKNYGDRQLYDHKPNSLGSKKSSITGHNAFKITGVQDGAAHMRGTHEAISMQVKQNTISIIEVDEGEAAAQALTKVGTHPALFHKFLEILLLMLTFYIALYFSHYGK
jgi:hypothetical protein